MKSPKFNGSKTGRPFRPKAKGPLEILSDESGRSEGEKLDGHGQVLNHGYDEEEIHEIVPSYFPKLSEIQVLGPRVGCVK